MTPSRSDYFWSGYTVLHALSQHFRDGSRIGVMPIGGHLFWSLSGHRFRTLEKALCRCHVPLGTEHRIDQLAFLIKGPIQIAALAAYLYRFRPYASSGRPRASVCAGLGQ
jgi:hypothetical protein